MFDVGFAEIFLLALIGLLVLGPERLPGVARTVGGFVRKAKTSWISLRRTIEAELAEADISAPIKQTSEELKQIGKDLADMQGFLNENVDSKVAEADPKPIDTPEAGPAEDKESTKAENV
jgi:sec-independent protein translocase protein TatB